MVGSAYGWKRATGREPADESDVENYKDHHLRATLGIFGEQLVWQCRACGLERSSTQYINDECPNNE